MLRILPTSVLPSRSTVLILAVLQLSHHGASLADNSTCASCHGTREPFSGLGPRADSLVVTDDQLTHSTHSGFDCVACHTDLTDVTHFPHAEDLAKVRCGECHADVAAAYQWHGRLQVGIGVDIPTCADCHGTHGILPASDRQSQVNPINLPRTCGRCHEDLDLVRKHRIPFEKPVAVYESSIHGRMLADSLLSVASCNDCHSVGGTAHRILPPDHVESAINHVNIPATCGQCHDAAEQEYREGIHGQRLAQGEAGAPVCTDCHGEHGILAPTDPRSPVSRSRVAEATCVPCHESARLNEKFAVPTGRVTTWVDSYHGLKSQAGDVNVANCASCHGGHRVLPSTDSTSSIHPSNLQNTCGHCHPGISVAAATAPIHGAPGVSRTAAARIVRNVYVVLIVVCTVGMFAYVLIDLRKQYRGMMMRPQVARMTTEAVWQHTLLFISFALLVLTGFALRFSEAWWVRLLFGWEGGFPVRGALHRVSAVLFLMTALWHLVYLMRKPGRQFLADIRPRATDFTQLREQLAFNLGLSSSRPEFGRFGYVEKVEYWALVWGTVIMAATGLLLWGESLVPRGLSRAFMDVVLVIHYYEAWLATLAILIWHVYSTILSPSVYPMNPAWLTGTMPADIYRHEHPRDPAAATDEQHETDPETSHSKSTDPADSGESQQIGRGDAPANGRS